MTHPVLRFVGCCFLLLLLWIGFAVAKNEIHNNSLAMSDGQFCRDWAAVDARIGGISYADSYDLCILRSEAIDRGLKKGIPLEEINEAIDRAFKKGGAL